MSIILTVHSIAWKKIPTGFYPTATDEAGCLLSGDDLLPVYRT